MKYTTIAIIYNPNSTGSSKQLAADFKANLEKHTPHQKAELIATEYAGHAEKLAYDLAKATKNPLIISSSGDGGYNEVINGAMKAKAEGANPTTGLLPAGNANDHYNNLHKEDMIEMILEGKSKVIDLLTLEGNSKGKKVLRYAHSYIGFGLTPFVGAELNKTKLTIFNEVWIVAKALFAVKAVRLKIGKKSKLYDSIIFSNVDRMSKYLNISQPSRVNDGKFEVTIFRKRNKIKLIILLLKASVFGIKEDKQVSEFHFETTYSTLAQLDGEILAIDGRSKITIGIDKKSLQCIV